MNSLTKQNKKFSQQTCIASSVLNSRHPHLKFISQMPSDSCNITINGIDQVMVFHDRYHRSLGREIKRVLRPGGVAFGVYSHAMDFAQNHFGAIPISICYDTGIRIREPAVEKVVTKQELSSV